jgi:TfoX/Sxy family transcriptional regulator of competence genes
MPYDAHLAERMRAALAGRRGISERAMFGGFCWMLNGNMLCGVEVGRFMFRVGKELEAKALAKAGARPIVFNGRRKRGLVWVDEEACRSRALASWIDFASRFVSALPPKQQKGRSRKGTVFCA